MKRKTINWADVQTYYDTGKTIAECSKYFGFSPDTARKAGKSGLLLIRNKSACQKSIPINSKRIDDLAEEYSSGKTWRELIKLGYKQSEYRYAKDHGLLTPRIGIEQSNARISKFGPNKPGLEARQKLSIRQSINNSGGRCKWYEVSGQKVQGTWERDFAIELDRRQIKWYKLKIHSDIIHYILDDKQKSYTPDFYLPDFGFYIEVKGYWWGRDKEKMKAVTSQNPNIDIRIVEKQQFKEFIHGKQIW